ncbi:MAG: protein-L-isoaspartate(D-aspartate) O-methyltransferase [Burkholderiaceae bacterium]
MPKEVVAKTARPGKPIAAPPSRPRAAAPATPIPKATRTAPPDAREQAETDRRERTQGTGHTRAGLTPERMRDRMVERLAASGIRHPAVLAAMAGVPRHRFVDEGLSSRAYDDTALPIGHAQTISQPYVVGRMTELIISDLPVLPRLARVLEIGTGCGYQAAVLAQVVGEVYSIERIRALHDRARDNLRALRVPNLRLVHGDGLLGLADVAPFDAMLIAAAGDALPDALLEQLKVGGRVLAPLSTNRARTGEQTLCLFIRTGRSNWSTTLLDAVRFVPLRPGIA